MHLRLDRVGVVFPVLEMGDWSLKSSIAQRVGARLTGSQRKPEVRALNDISFDLKPGDRLGIIGHNGAGKSTLLKVCAGIYEPTSGAISRAGSVASMTDFLMGMDPQETGYKNIVRRGIFMGLTRKEAQSIIPDVEAFSELGEFLKLPMRTYSTGMYIRLAFAISTSVEPDILIMDEMINAGDMAFLDKSKTRMASLIQNSKIMVLAAHDLELVRRLCSQAIVLEKGEIVARGSADECIDFYTTTVMRGSAV